ncbi:aminopeptidase P family protein [Aliiroseovarius sp. PTFE2010]|uniref:aminopeptidase P family protein n=1 Tax=Aliiroseovarius sp. PTFE2010 TaxID=3417190 RepID=UPI003CF1A32E
MFQTFDSTGSSLAGSARLAALRAVMKAQGLDGFLVPRADMFQGEYVADCDMRLDWLTGFSGSAGFAAILADRAGVFVDGRYRVQVREQVDLDVFTPVDWPEVKLADWLEEALPQGATVGFDPWLHTVSEIEALETTLAGKIRFARVDNLVDAIWKDRPPRPRAPVRAMATELTGRDHADKRSAIAQSLKAGKADAQSVILTQPDSICWLLNIRGGDIPRNPVVHAFAVLDETGAVHLFTDAQIGPDVIAHLGDEVQIGPLDGLLGFIAAHPTTCYQIDPANCPVAVYDHLEKTAQTPAPSVRSERSADPCSLPKACKNQTELEGARAAHLRDGAAMVEFLSWLDAQPPGTVTEIDVVKALEGFRRATNALQDISFDTICGAGAHGAIVHYRVTNQTNAVVEPGLLLVDSGGQYLDGTTDITRTIAIGPAGAQERQCFTRVLQGMIAISRARFPRGVAGQHLDALARAPLWMAGQDYDHGTGHGVGSYLCVHEGPQRLSRVSDVALQPGMILSNEPGYYREGAFGIRIENLIAVRKAPPLPGGDDRDMLDFETLTFVPIDRNLIARDALSRDERQWVDAYHERCRALLEDRVGESARAWLRQATAPL